jgi:hypothetical protein
VYLAAPEPSEGPGVEVTPEGPGVEVTPEGPGVEVTPEGPGVEVTPEFEPGLSRTALVCGPTIPSAGAMLWFCWKSSTAFLVSGPNMPSTGMLVPLSVFSSVCSWFMQPPL